MFSKVLLDLEIA